MITEAELEGIACRAAAWVFRHAGQLEPLEDLEQEARIAVIAAMLTYQEGKSDLRGYLWTKARNHCIDYVRALHGMPGTRPEMMPLEDRASKLHAGFEAIDLKDSHRKAKRIQRMQEKEKPSKPKPIERVGGPGKVGGPVTVCGILFERISRSVLMTLPNGQTASCDMLHFRHAMHLLFGEKKDKG